MVRLYQPISLAISAFELAIDNCLESRIVGSCRFPEKFSRRGRSGRLQPQLRHCRKIRFTQVARVDVVVDIDRLVARVAAQLLDVLARHPVAQQMGGDEMAVAMGREPLGRVLAGRVVQPDPGGILHDGVVDAAA